MSRKIDKFKVRVKFDYYFENKSWYKIQYSTFALFPIWRNVYSFQSGLGMACVCTRHFTHYESAVIFAKKIENIKDVKELHDIAHFKYKEWNRQRTEIYNSTKPKHKITNIFP